MSDLPSYPQDAAEREAAAGPPEARHDYAGWGRRLGAYLLDVLVLVVPFIAILVIALAAGNPEDENDTAWAVIGFSYLAWIFLPFLYFTLLHGRESGQTLGKRLVGIRVVDAARGGSIGYGRAFGRYAITFVFSLFCFIPLVLDHVWPLWDEKRQALHDKVVSSVVVKA